MSDEKKNKDLSFYDLVIVGAGPHALSLMTRLLIDAEDKYEERPNNEKLFTCSKTGKFQARIKDNPQTRKTPRQLKTYLHGKIKTGKDLSRICVVDKHGCWLTQWAKQFDVLSISHLRSTTSVHPDAFDLQALKAFAAEQNREDELSDISRTIRGADFTGPFIIPSTDLFWDFCKHIVKQYGLENMVKSGIVVSMEDVVDGYKLNLKDNMAIHAKSVVIATGNGWIKRIPTWAKDIYETNNDRTVIHTSDLVRLSEVVGIGSKHQLLPSPRCRSSIQKSSMSLRKDNLDLDVGKIVNHFDWMLEGKDVLIVGGGLSSGHLAIKASLLGANLVHFVCRSQLKVRQFDLELEWVGRNRFKKLAEFYSIQDFQERFTSIQVARRGGSITPSVQQHLLKLRDEGRLSIHEQTEVWDCERFPAGSSVKWKCDLSDEQTIVVDEILLATGSNIDVSQNLLMSSVLRMRPLKLIEGLPVLTENLEWGDGSSIYVMGASAALQLGPDALNIAGGRSGGSRIAYKLKKSMELEKSSGKSTEAVVQAI